VATVVVELVVAQPLLQVTGHNWEVRAQYCCFSAALAGNARNKQPSEGASKLVLSCTNCLNPSLSSTQLEDGDGVGVDALGDTVSKSLRGSLDGVDVGDEDGAYVWPTKEGARVVCTVEEHGSLPQRLPAS